ncbi:MAG TPA: hypothetical protein VJP45_13110 [Candidatus Limnocylindria bacterium]|nr:hypothetical protein [Candidatus Limnocylindria bacterium]
MKAWRGALATLVVLTAVIAVLGVRPTSTAERAASQSSAPSPAASPSLTFHSKSSGFDVQLPRGWTATDESTLFGRSSVRLLVIGNRGTEVPYPPDPSPPPGRVPDWSRMQPDRIVLELVLSAGPGGPSREAAATESTFPLDWGGARPIPDGSGSTAPALFFQHLLRGLMLVAHIGAAADQADVAQIPDIVASLAPEPIPARGEYRGWEVVGPLASYPVGTVTHFGSGPSSAYGFYLVRGAKTVFAFVDRAHLFMGAMKPCPIRYDLAARTFVCDGSGERWSRVGKQLAAPDFFGLPYRTAFVKEGLVLVGGGMGGGGRNTYDESVEFNDPIIAPLAMAPPTRTQILDRYAHITSTAPITRSSAKLVPADVIINSQVLPVSFIPAQTRTVWIIAFAGEVRMPGSANVHGHWTVFLADPLTGGVINAACCGAGDWPDGFDRLPDLAR